MMKKTLALLLLPALSGCLTAEVSTTSTWPVDYQPAAGARAVQTYGVTRLMPVKVRPPYNRQELAVMRENGTVAFDPYNGYAAMPAQLLKGVVMDALAASGRFASVIDTSSIVSESHAVEVSLTNLALDCRKDGERRAVVELTLSVIENRSIVSTAKGAAEADAADGNYGLAFSAALSDALRAALAALK